MKQAPRAWFDKLKQALLQYGFQSSKSDTSLFFKRNGGKLILILIYVDDILITGDDSLLIQKVIRDLNGQFALKTLGSVNNLVLRPLEIKLGYICLKERM